MAKADLTKGVYIKLEGEMGKYHTIPIDDLIAISQKFQELINGIAKHTIDGNELEMENFKIELCDLRKSSVAPGFIFSPRVNPALLGDHNSQRKAVNVEFGKLLNVANKGDYSSLKKLYKNKEERNEMIPLVYDFVDVFGTTPVQIGAFSGKKFVSGKKIKTFKPEVYKTLVGVTSKKKKEKAQSIDLAGIVTLNLETKRTKVKSYFDVEKGSLSHTFSSMIIDGCTRPLNDPLCVPCHYDSDKNFNLDCPQLNIYSVGKDLDEAIKNFNDDFEHLYFMVHDKPDNQLGPDMIKARNYLSLLLSI